MQATASTVTLLLCFSSLSRSGLRLFHYYYYNFFFINIFSFLVSPFYFSLKSFYLLGETFAPRRGGFGIHPAAEWNVLLLQLLGWGRRPKPISCSWIYSGKDCEGAGWGSVDFSRDLGLADKPKSMSTAELGGGYGFNHHQNAKKTFSDFSD